ncbi:hypothetical protein ACLOJK_035286 [Asimina triloba]
MVLLPFGKKRTHIQNTPKIVLLLTLSLGFAAIVTLCYPLLSPAFPWNLFSSSYSSTSPLKSIDRQQKNNWAHENCNLFKGKWVPNPDAPYCTNTTCRAIYDHQNCMKYGRPDRDFMKWRWKPDDCGLPIFDPVQFLKLVRGKSLIFVGDCWKKPNAVLDLPLVKDKQANKNRMGIPAATGHWPNDNVVMPNDCVHWCLPDAVDAVMEKCSPKNPANGLKTTIQAH